MSRILSPFQLLELNVISAQDLAHVARKMRTYAVAWVHPNRKLSTRVNVEGHNHPTWNDKFVFRVDDEFLYGDTSAVMIEIYALHWFRDIHVGTVRVIVGNLIPPTRPHHHHHVQLGMRFVALQVRRPSGRPQGILNIGVALLDSSMRSMPLYTQLGTSAVGYRHLMGEEDPYSNKDDEKGSDYLFRQLRRTKSDSSSMIRTEMVAKRNMKTGKASSMVSGSEVEKKQMKKKKKYYTNNNNNNNNKKGRSQTSSMTSGSEFDKEMIVRKTKNYKPGSFLSESDLGTLPKTIFGSEVVDNPIEKVTNLKKVKGLDNGALYNKNYPYVNPKRLNYTGGAIITESELGPSASEVAAALMKNKYNRVEEMEGSVMGDWSLASSMEGLQSKLERWREELPPVYDDASELSSFPISSAPSHGGKVSNKHTRRHTNDGTGNFSCFGNICGLEISIVCGGSSTREQKGGGRAKRSSSSDYLSFL